MSPLDRACKAARKCSSCLVAARWRRREETPAQLLADPSFIPSLPDSALDLNPVGRLRRLRPQLGEPTMTFDPCEFAGWADDPASEAYTKRTQLFGRFNPPQKRRVEPGRSIIHMAPDSKGRADRRSATPSGFARAFFEANR